MHETRYEIMKILDPPEPQKVDYSKTHVFKDPPYPEKVTKMTPKGSPNGSKIDPMAPQGHFKASKKTNENRRQKKTTKNQKK